MLSKLKRALAPLFDSAANFFHNLGFSPTAITFLGFFFASLSAVAYYLARFQTNRLLLASLLLLVSGFFDALDGVVARKFRKVTRLGGVLDSTFDRLGETLVYLGILLGGLVTPGLCAVTLALSLIVSYVRARVEVEGLNLSGVGFAERPERLVLLAFFTLINQLRVGLIVIASLSALTIIQRLLYSYEKLK